jgi:hypothetical protein
MSQDLYHELDALSAHVRRRNLDATTWPIVAAHSVGLTIGALIAAGALTPCDAQRQIDVLRRRMLEAAGVATEEARDE